MALLWNVTHDAGNLDEYDGTVTDGGDLSASVGSAMAGTTNGMAALVDDTTAIYASMNWNGASGNELRFRFYFDPNDFTRTEGGDNYTQISYFNLTNAPWNAGTLFLFTDVSETEYTLRLRAREDDGTDLGSTYHAILNDANYIEVHIERASSNVADDGQARMWINGVLKETIEDVDNYDLWDVWEKIDLGADTVAANSSGTLYFDEFKANDDGTEIGPVSAGISLPVLEHHYRHKVFG